MRVILLLLTLKLKECVQFRPDDFLIETEIKPYFMEAIRCQKIQSLKLDNAYFGSTNQISKNLIVDPRVTY
jgi:hypothetical protein